MTDYILCRAMLPEERKNLSLFTSAARQRVSGQLGCSAQQVHVLPRKHFVGPQQHSPFPDDREAAMQVDDCIAKYLWMQNMVQKMAERKKQGLAMPTSITEVEEQLGVVPGSFVI